MDIENKLEKLAHAPGLPRHIAIIMDGNGRWASRRHLPRIAGHRAGRESVRVAVRTCARLGIEVLSLYTFSLQNWKRPPAEVKALMHFLGDVLESEYLELDQNDIRLRAEGRIGLLPEETRRTLDETIGSLSRNSGMILNLCLSYGGREEIVDAAVRIASRVASGELDVGDIDEKTFRENLYAPELPDPDLLIRTSGEMRVSNFLLWQIAYTELTVLDVLWPDFREEHVIRAVEDYMSRERRFGGIGGESGDAGD